MSLMYASESLSAVASVSLKFVAAALSTASFPKPARFAKRLTSTAVLEEAVVPPTPVVFSKAVRNSKLTTLSEILPSPLTPLG